MRRNLGMAGGLLLGIYQTWAVRRGFVAWSALVWNTQGTEGDLALATYPTWRRLWPWILLSYVVLACGLLLGIIGFSLTGSA